MKVRNPTPREVRLVYILTRLKYTSKRYWKIKKELDRERALDTLTAYMINGKLIKYEGTDES